MKLGFRIFLFYLAIFAACLYFTTDWIWTTLRTRYLESVEEPLVDAANVLASLVEQEMARPDFTFKDLEAPLARAHSRALSARIYDFEKSAVDLQLYITDAAGRVVLRHAPALGLGRGLQPVPRRQAHPGRPVRRPRFAPGSERSLFHRALHRRADL